MGRVKIDHTMRGREKEALTFFPTGGLIPWHSFHRRQIEEQLKRLSLT